jgi:hypothetical protein
MQIKTPNEQNRQVQFLLDADLARATAGGDEFDDGHSDTVDWNEVERAESILDYREYCSD